MSSWKTSKNVAMFHQFFQLQWSHDDVVVENLGSIVRARQHINTLQWSHDDVVVENPVWAE